MKDGGLFRKKNFRDACGVGFIANVYGESSHSIVRQGLDILDNLEHRGAVGADPLVGDGAGILTQIPHQLFRKVFAEKGKSLPESGDYAVGMVFLPRNETISKQMICRIEEVVKQRGQEIVFWREVPSDNGTLSKNMLDVEPKIMQFFVNSSDFDETNFERKLYVLRCVIEKKINEEFPTYDDVFCITSLSCRTIVYKGMFLAYQLRAYYPDLSDPDFVSSIALMHQRYSTNTFPAWGLAQPFRMIAHNGEINTIQGNRNWAKARESQLRSNLFGSMLEDLFPIVKEEGSDSAGFDNYFEFLAQTGRDLDHVMMLMMPEAWENDPEMPENLRAFYEYASTLIEPWDGPATIAFTNGYQIGAAVDRNGLRPARYVETHDGLFVLASEVGVLEIPDEKIKSKGMLGAGEIILVDTNRETIDHNQTIKQRIASKYPYFTWIKENKIFFKDLPHHANAPLPDHATIRLRQRIFSYTYEELYLLIKPMADQGMETTYAMGTDTPLAVLSKRPKLLYSYFKQRFAQVTNPPIDSIREEMVMSLGAHIGGGYNILDDISENCKMLELSQPVLTNFEVEQLRALQLPAFRSWSVSILFEADKGSLEEALEKICREVEEKVDEGYRIMILSDRGVNAQMAPIPALLATSAIHHDLIRKNKRGKIGIIVESGEVREVHHLACLIGFGAGAVNPYLAFETIHDMAIKNQLDVSNDDQQAEKNYIQAMQKGLKKIFAKMGISTLQSYHGAQIFEVIGISDQVMDKYFPGTQSEIQGTSLKELESEVLKMHRRAFAPQAKQIKKLLTGGEYNWRNQGEFHSYGPEVVHLLQQASWRNDREIYRKYSKMVDDQSENLCTLRGLFEFKDDLPPVPLEEVETKEEIVRRFCTGAMSIGSISREAHETLAIAMNDLNAKSNTGEGGEDEVRFQPDENGDLRRSAIKQVASGRFGVTSYYLTNADELQIKVAQGAKPGEGGQLPGFKVDEYIAKLRHTIPGVTLISPPPHHDIYSIEDLSQLIFDLKNANRNADVSVKLVASHGIGLVAAGVAKAKSDLIIVSGYDGGTGASPATSIKHAGIPWEIGLAETQQTLVANHLRGQVRLQADGQLKTARDVIIAALLGAEEFGFATSALIAAGCIMMRKCHLNTCPVGIATQDPYLRSKYHGKPEYVKNFFLFIAEEIREIMAKLGYRKFDEMIGQSDRLKQKSSVNVHKTNGIDLSRIFHKVDFPESEYRKVRNQVHAIDSCLDLSLIEQAKPSLESRMKTKIDCKIRNRNRTAGTILGSEITKKFGNAGLPEDTVKVNFEGTAGQSFGAFIPKGLTLDLLGDANDYVGKGLSGGKIIIKPKKTGNYDPGRNIISGNTCLYGATSGKAFFNGMVGQRFAVRNSGATAVVEGVGDHCCEYMTGGTVVVLGKTGRNFGAGMSGGIAYVYDNHRVFKRNCNLAMVEVEELTYSHHQDTLHELLQEHYEVTGSPNAKKILADFDRKVKKFVMVIPFEYRKVLASIVMKKAV